MGQAFGCSCEVSQDQEEISLMQPVVKESGRREAANKSMLSPDDSDIVGSVGGKTPPQLKDVSSDSIQDRQQ